MVLVDPADEDMVDQLEAALGGPAHRNAARLEQYRQVRKCAGRSLTPASPLRRLVNIGAAQNHAHAIQPLVLHPLRSLRAHRRELTPRFALPNGFRGRIPVHTTPSAKDQPSLVRDTELRDGFVAPVARCRE